MEEEVLAQLNPEEDYVPEEMLGKVFKPSVERLRLILMFFLCLSLVGAPTGYGKLIETLCGFVPLCFYLLSGYFILGGNPKTRPKRILRTIKKSAVVFFILLFFDFSFNALFYSGMGANVFVGFASKRFWFDFLVLNSWPYLIGNGIWYVQAYLYAFLGFYLLEKLRFFEKNIFPVLTILLTLAFTTLFGELCGILRFNILGYTYVSGNFLTRALPYLLLGYLIKEKEETLLLKSRLLYWLGVFAGLVLATAETLVLEVLLFSPGYYGHLLGLGVTAFSLVCLALQDEKDFTLFENYAMMGKWEINGIYYLAQPISVVIAFLFTYIGSGFFEKYNGLIGIVTFFVCYLICYCAELVRRMGLLDDLMPKRRN